MVRGISFKRHRFSPDVIRYACWLYFRFTLSFRDVEELLAERGIEVSYETIRRWTIKFGPQFAANLKALRPPPSPRWHLDEMVCRVGGKRMHLWRSVDDEGEVLELLMEPGRDSWSAIKLIANIMLNHDTYPEKIVTDGHPSYRAATNILRVDHLHHAGRLRENNRAENSHLPIRRRERKMQRFKSRESAQLFLTSHAAVYNTFNVQQHLIRRSTLREFRATARVAWQTATASSPKR